MQHKPIPSTRRPAGLESFLTLLRQRESDLRRRGLIHVGIFGSTARGEDAPSSDVDVMIEVYEGARFGTEQMLELERELSSVFGRHVEVVSCGGLRSPKHDSILRDLRLAF
jgi:predicted nucleotidyltransferase